jgi:TrmH family RNA methyltransferase
MFEHIRFVLVETSHPGNIGAAARAMKTMGLGRLALVRPKTFPCAEATARASGADDLLAAAAVHDDLDAALMGVGLVLGTSARLRTLTWPQVDARTAAGQIHALGNGTEVAVLFGRERTGLTNAELDRCHHLLHIPVNPAYGSLNIAAAVQIVAYEIRMTAPGTGGVGDYLPERPATAEQMEGLYGHLEQTLVAIRFLDPGNPRYLMRRLRRLFNRAHLGEEEVNILRGILAAIRRRIGEFP